MMKNKETGTLQISDMMIFVSYVIDNMNKDNKVLYRILTARQRYLKSCLACLGVKNNSPLNCFLNHHQLRIVFCSGR